MYIMYVDESGDSGSWNPSVVGPSPSRHYILTGLIIHVTDWRNYVSELHSIKREIRHSWGLPVREELHGTEIINPRKSLAYKSISGGRKARTDLYRYALHNLSLRLPNIKIINVCLDKTVKTTNDVQTLAWNRLIQRFNTFLVKVDPKSYGCIITDDSDEKKIRSLLRKMRVYNYVPSKYSGSRGVPVANIIEDPIMRDSQNSYFIQYADLIAYALYHKEYPRGSYKKYNIDKLFREIDSLLLKVASAKDPDGIVRN